MRKRRRADADALLGILFRWWKATAIIMLGLLLKQQQQQQHHFAVRAWMIAPPHASHYYPLRMRSSFVRRRLLSSSTMSTSSSSSSSSRSMSARWQIGDLVSLPVPIKEEQESSSSDSKSTTTSSRLIGTIQEHRGAGWYAVQLLKEAAGGNNETVIKIRGTKLRRVMSSSSPQEQQQQRSPRTAVQQTLSSSIPTITIPHSQTQTRLPTDTTTTSLSTPPPPSIIDLDAAVQALDENSSNDRIENKRDRFYLQQVAHFRSAVQKWIVFTDLHCAPSTLETSLQVLDTVHQLAVERGEKDNNNNNNNVGVLFLGDFWHHRGTLRVDCLNAVLHALGNWTVPMVLIPGNHDQVTLGGHNHGLTPLENAYRVAVNNDDDDDGATTTIPGPLVLSRPTKFANALFVPHIRDHAIMESILQSKLAHEASALFVHADVTGAYMNDLIVSLGGVPPYMFPPHKPIYSGHFHKPHIVKSGDVTIEYLGSPYEVSLAEAQQPKALAVLDATDGWKCIERIPLDIGRKHFRVASLDEFLALEPVNNTIGLEKENQQQQQRALIVNAGDRVVLSMGRDELEEIWASSKESNITNELDTHVQLLRKCGAVVEIREIKELPNEPMGVGGASDAGELEELTPESTWRAFLDEEVRRGAMTNTTAESLLEAGLDLLGDLEADNEEFRFDLRQTATELKLSSVTVEGFGPFRDPITYPLWDRGLVLLRGVNKDGGSDSNGSGKTSLAMSALWCLTGSLDPRPLQDSKVSDVVNDFSKTARVTVRGFLNGVDFSITRSKTASRSGLVFMLGEEDLTAQSVKDTQLILEEKLGVGPEILGRMMFHGQHAVNDLLESTDTKLKDELSLVVPLSVWQEAASSARKRSREAAKKVDQLDGMLSVRALDLEDTSQRLEEAKADFAERESCFKEREFRLAAEDDRVSAHFQDSQSLAETLRELEEEMISAAKAVSEAESTWHSMQDDRNEQISLLEDRLEEKNEVLASLNAKYLSLQQEYATLSARSATADERIRDLEQTWNLDLSSGVPTTFSIPGICPTCRQPLQASGQGHSHADLQNAVQQDVEVALRDLELARSVLNDIESTMEKTGSSLRKTETQLVDIRADLDVKVTHLANLMEQREKDVLDARSVHDQLSTRFTAVAREMREVASVEALNSTIKSEMESLRVAKAAVDTIEAELTKYESIVNELQTNKEEQTGISSTMMDLSTAFGQRGIQTFVLQYAVDQLQSSAQAYLDELSDGAQRLQLSLDTGDRISRRAFVRQEDGHYKERPLASLSGGQWRRCSLALTLGFADLVSRRGKLRTSLIVLDEPLTHLDRSGRSDVGRMLRRLVHRTNEGQSSFIVSTIILILQDLAAEELEEVFDCSDEVVMSHGTSSVFIDDIE